MSLFEFKYHAIKSLFIFKLSITKIRNLGLMYDKIRKNKLLNGYIRGNIRMMSIENKVNGKKNLGGLSMHNKGYIMYLLMS